jgi:hypothetical protein
MSGGAHRATATAGREGVGDAVRREALVVALGVHGGHWSEVCGVAVRIRRGAGGGYSCGGLVHARVEQTQSRLSRVEAVGAVNGDAVDIGEACGGAAPGAQPNRCRLVQQTTIIAATASVRTSRDGDDGDGGVSARETTNQTRPANVGASTIRRGRRPSH